MEIPNSCLSYILLQRTKYSLAQKIAQNKFFSLAHQILLPLAIKTETFLRKNEIKKLYSKDMEEDFRSIQDHLPKQINSVLDIGCGVGGINILISKHYNYKADIYLLDKSTTDTSIHYGFEQTGSYYNSLSIAREFLGINGIPSEKIHTIEVPDDGKIPLNQKIDLVVSFISWGFHYPVETYLTQVHELLNPNGVMIIDVRKNTEGERKIAEIFGNISIVSKYPKYNRVIAQKLP